jgi:hypothetical protein
MRGRSVIAQVIIAFAFTPARAAAQVIALRLHLHLRLRPLGDRVRNPGARARAHRRSPKSSSFARDRDVRPRAWAEMMRGRSSAIAQVIIIAFLRLHLHLRARPRAGAEMMRGRSVCVGSGIAAARGRAATARVGRDALALIGDRPSHHYRLLAFASRGARSSCYLSDGERAARVFR